MAIIKQWNLFAIYSAAFASDKLIPNFCAREAAWKYVIQKEFKTISGIPTFYEEAMVTYRFYNEWVTNHIFQREHFLSLSTNYTFSLESDLLILPQAYKYKYTKNSI